ncbi:hypothetical protein TrVE_jg5374 [Triparma verrucosa]|uniref:Uncharacterized protein n=2 Tax=Triparma TaxID=722752 RepID=A0A9W7B0J9_9STRA|nr:hypothetical protein TrST_g10347 [Triparma strigata]GMH81829.1 hypothetical protein TrVE_jg5374 [Triparma verrucosa]
MYKNELTGSTLKSPTKTPPTTGLSVAFGRTELHGDVKRRTVDPQSTLSEEDVKSLMARDVKLFKVTKDVDSVKESWVGDYIGGAGQKKSMESVGAILRERRRAEAEKRSKMWEERGGSEDADI